MSARKVTEEAPQVAVRKRAQGLLMTVLLQLLLGMAVNLIGLPMQTAGAAKIASEIVLALHILIAVGMVAGGILTVVQASRLGPPFARAAWTGFALIIVTFAAGVLTAITDSGWWSYLMAAGATALLVIYGMLYVRAGRGNPQPAS